MSASEITSGLIGKLSEEVGVTEAALRLLISVFLGYPLALIYRKFIYGKEANLQYSFCIATGFLLGYFNNGFDTLHSVFTIFVSYLFLLVLGGTSIMVGAVFIFNMIYLLVGYYCSGTDNYDINWTMPQCVLVLRLIGIAFDYLDGQQDPKTLGAENKKVALQKLPSLLEFYGYMLFPASFMVGPQFSMKRYQDFIAGKFSDPKTPGQPPKSEQACLRRFGQGLIYLGIFQMLGLFVSDNYMMSEEFYQTSFIKKFLLLGLWGRFSLYKYISCWLLTEGACILFGVSHNGEDEKGNTKWNGLENVKLAIFENTTEFNDYILAFNVNTNHWIAQYIYKRLKFLGNRHLSQLFALVFLAIWHGFHSGYYVCFFFEFIVVHLERDFKSIVKSNDSLNAFFSNSNVQIVTTILLRLYTFVFMGWCLLPFVLLTFHRYWLAFANAYYSGIIIFVLWPIIYSPLLKIIFKKSKSSKDTLKETVKDK